MSISSFHESVIRESISKYRGSQIGAVILSITECGDLDRKLRGFNYKNIALPRSKLDYIDFVLAKYPELKDAFKFNKSKAYIVDMMINGINLKVDEETLKSEYSELYDEDLELEFDYIYNRLKKLQLIKEIKKGGVNG